MNLTDEELDAVYTSLYHEVYYETYGDSPHADFLRAAIVKIDAECRARGLWE